MSRKVVAGIELVDSGSALTVNQTTRSRFTMVVVFGILFYAGLRVLISGVQTHRVASIAIGAVLMIIFGLFLLVSIGSMSERFVADKTSGELRYKGKPIGLMAEVASVKTVKSSSTYNAVLVFKDGSTKKIMQLIGFVHAAEANYYASAIAEYIGADVQPVSTAPQAANAVNPGIG